MEILPEFLVVISFATLIQVVSCNEDINMKRKSDLIQESSDETIEGKQSFHQDTQVERYKKVHNLEKRQPVDKVCANGPAKLGNDSIECGTNKQNCSENTWCHLGGFNETTICCNITTGEENPCILDMYKGIGNDKLTRFFYDKKSDICKSFTYKGFKGNPNMFLTEAKCKNTCSVCSIGHNGKTCDLEAPLPLVCYDTDFWCNLGEDEKHTKLCCKKNTTANRCMHPMNKGVGSDDLSRFHYDSRKDKCFEFKFKGRLGNENIFLTIEDCEKDCSTKHVCTNGPYKDGKDVRKCGTGELPCSKKSWCNLGEALDKNVCCNTAVGEENQCLLDKKEGSGSYRLNRFFYDKKSDECKNFTYKGTQGNPNMFMTEPECKKTCKVCTNGTTGETCDLEALQPVVCAGGSWCNLGEDDKNTKICCKKDATVNRCMLPNKIGVGFSEVKRFYYNSKKDKCFDFIYKGRSGNENMFLNSPECKEACSVCKNGPLLSNEKVIGCSSSLNCPNGSFCNFGSTADTRVCCKRAFPNLELCSLHFDQGKGSDTNDLYYYDRSSDKCKIFNYKGRQGNENVFKDIDTCNKTCVVCQHKVYIDSKTNKSVVCDINNSSEDKKCPKDAWCNLGNDDVTRICCEKASTSDDPCQYDKNTGHGNRSISRYYYNYNEDKCLTFEYESRLGNQNMFPNEQGCNAACLVCDNGAAMDNSGRAKCTLDQTHDPARGCPNGSWCNLGSNENIQICCERDTTNPDPCSMPVRKGRGTNSETRFYYDPNSDQCQNFQYEGRSGNQNMFLKSENCSDLCAAQHSCLAGTLTNPETDADQECNLDFSAGLEKQCPDGTWCHLGTTNKTKICCKEAVTDPCSLQLEKGTGIAFLERFFYNSSSSKCERFEYKGRGGNQNMFMDLADCRIACEDAHPLCQNGSFKDNVSGQDRLCSIASGADTSCPEDYWCHYGETINSTVCCKQTHNDTCKLDVDVGRGNATLKRFYYNPTKNKCTKFFYRGRLGNQNMFDNPNQCFTACGELHAVCQLGALRDNALSDDRRCNITSGLLKSCPDDSWCHAGNSNNTTVCCYGDIGDICTFPMNEGNGNASLERYYYDPSSDHCDNFTYKGYLGNQNMFVDPNDCYDKCGVCINGVLSDSTLETSVQCNLDYRSGKEEQCPTDSWCHLGNSSQTKVCCLGATSDPCTQPRNDGEGIALLNRYFHNSATGECEELKYKGRRGNQNMFIDELECNIACKNAHPLCMNGSLKDNISGQDQKCSVDPGAEVPCPTGFWCHLGETEESTVCCKKENEMSPCSLPMDLGRGSGSIQRFYFDNAAGQCKEFQYRGRLGNPNMFGSASDCALACGNGCLHGTLRFKNTTNDHPCHPESDAKDACPAGTWCHIGNSPLTTVCCQNAEPDPCSLKIDQGRGDASMERYFYNSDANKCETFIYKGYLGNQNMFLDSTKCNHACYKPTTVATTTTSKPDAKDMETTAAGSNADNDSSKILGLKKGIFIALIIVVIIIIIIVLLLCWFFLCRKNDKKSTKAKAGKTKKSHTKHGKSKKPILNKKTIPEKQVKNKHNKPAKPEETGVAKPRPDKPKRHRGVEKKKDEKKGETKPTEKKDSKSRKLVKSSDKQVKEKYPIKEISLTEPLLEQRPKVEDAKVAGNMAVDKEIKPAVNPEPTISERMKSTQKDSVGATPAIVKRAAPAQKGVNALTKQESKSTPRPPSPEVSASSGSPESASDERPSSVSESDVSVVRPIEAPSKPKVTLVPMPKRRY